MVLINKKTKEEILAFYDCEVPDLDNIEKYSIIGDIWDCLLVKLPYKLECVGCISVSNKEMITLQPEKK